MIYGKWPPTRHPQMAPVARRRNAIGNTNGIRCVTNQRMSTHSCACSRAQKIRVAAVRRKHRMPLAVKSGCRRAPCSHSVVRFENELTLAFRYVLSHTPKTSRVDDLQCRKLPGLIFRSLRFRYLNQILLASGTPLSKKKNCHCIAASATRMHAQRRQ